MPFTAYPPLPRKRRRNATLHLTGPRDTKKIKKLNQELKKLLRKHGATYKKRKKKKK